MSAFGEGRSTRPLIVSSGSTTIGRYVDRFAIGAPVDVVTRPDDAGLTLLVFRLRES
jgi:hypothetical protein